MFKQLHNNIFCWYGAVASIQLWRINLRILRYRTENGNYGAADSSIRYEYHDKYQKNRVGYHEYSIDMQEMKDILDKEC